jgi:hypothetical protein
MQRRTAAEELERGLRCWLDTASGNVPADWWPLEVFGMRRGYADDQRGELVAGSAPAEELRLELLQAGRGIEAESLQRRLEAWERAVRLWRKRAEILVRIANGGPVKLSAELLEVQHELRELARTLLAELRVLAAVLPKAEPDGPVEPRGFRWQGELLQLPARHYELLAILWESPSRAVYRVDVEADVLKLDDPDSERYEVSSLLKHVNRWLASHAVPYRVAQRKPHIVLEEKKPA